MSTQTALERVDSQEIGLIYDEWTPESLELAIRRENAMRQVVIKYFKSAMNEGHHYYRLSEAQNTKPALSKEGALNLCSLFKVRPDEPQIIETYHDDGHYTVRAKINLLSLKNEMVLASGDGLCSTKESKYAFRWVWANQVPAEVNKDTLKKKTLRNNSVQYQLPNENLADLYNTTLKMAAKRALVDAVLKLPLVSELFTQDLDEQIAENTQKKQAETQTRSAQVKDEGHRDAPNGKDDMRQKVTNLLEKLKERDFSESELLGNFGYQSVEQIPDEELGDIVKDLSKTLNAALNNK